MTALSSALRRAGAVATTEKSPSGVIAVKNLGTGRRDLKLS